MSKSKERHDDYQAPRRPILYPYRSIELNLNLEGEMIRRRIIIEWDDEGTDTDEDVLKDFLNENWDVFDLLSIDQSEDTRNHVNVKVWVEDAPK